METEAKRPWERKLEEAGTRAEEELRRVVTYINDEVMPEVRRNGSNALRTAAQELEKLAGRMEDRRRTPATEPPAGKPGDASR